MIFPAKPITIPSKLQSLFSDALKEKLLSLREDLHRHPELSSREERTARRLFEELESLHPTHLGRVAKTGVIARIEGKSPSAPVVAIRGDIDALPIQEATGLQCTSINSGVMHACGHDVHATWTIGAAHLLAENPAEGDVLVLLQPAEETGKGALAVLEEGALKDAAAIFGAHVDRRYLVGEVIVQEGPLAASADMFEITLKGKGSHGARPHESSDPIVAAGTFIGALQTIVSRRLNPADAAVVSIGTIHAGSAPNIIPENATLSGTLRAFTPEIRQFLHDEVRRIAEGTAEMHRLKVEVTIEQGPPPIVNPATPVAWARQAMTSLLGEEAITSLKTLNLASEDFAYYMENIPGCFLRIGAREEGGKPIPSHSPYFYAADESIFVGAAGLAETARVASMALCA